MHVDDFIQVTQATDTEALRHCSHAILHDIHSVFPPPTITGHSGEEPISMKKLLEGEGFWEVWKEILGWMMDGATRCIELAEKKRKAILAELRTVLRMRRDVPLKRMQKLVDKLRHAVIGIPAGKYLFVPIQADGEGAPPNLLGTRARGTMSFPRHGTADSRGRRRANACQGAGTTPPDV
ncbi:hypothetical protein ACHAWF_008474 [Thalassiosira exigua]